MTDDEHVANAAFRWEVSNGAEEVSIHRRGSDVIELGIGPWARAPNRTIGLDRTSARLLAHALMLHSETLK